MTDVSSFSLDDLGDYLIENDIPSDTVLLFCGKRAHIMGFVCQLTTRVIFPLCDYAGFAHTQTTELMVIVFWNYLKLM
jgi:hypothetical protein